MERPSGGEARAGSQRTRSPLAFQIVFWKQGVCREAGNLGKIPEHSEDADLLVEPFRKPRSYGEPQMKTAGQMGDSPFPAARQVELLSPLCKGLPSLHLEQRSLRVSHES